MTQSTAWGSQFTFGWEFEGTDAAVWDWFYDPDDPNMNAEAWSKLSEEERLEWCRDYGWSTLQKRDTCPPFIAGIERESVVDEGVIYELKSAPCDSTAILRQQISAVYSKLRRQGDYSNFQVHVVFGMPRGVPTNPQVFDMHALVAALFHLLNDFVWAKSATLGAEAHYRVHTGPTTRKIAQTNTRLRSGASLESTLGSYKRVNVGLRDLYRADRSLVGFELRKGVHDSLDRLIRVVELITFALANPNAPINMHQRVFPELQTQLRALKPGVVQPIAEIRRPYALVNHYNFVHFSQNAGPPALEEPLMTQLSEEARVVFTAARRIPMLALDGTEGGEILNRWLLAFRPWEAHPAIRDHADTRTRITTSRTLLKSQLAEYFRRTPDRRNQSRYSSPTDEIDYVSKLIQAHLNMLALHLYM